MDEKPTIFNLIRSDLDRSLDMVVSVSIEHAFPL